MNRCWEDKNRKKWRGKESEDRDTEQVVEERQRMEDGDEDDGVTR